MNKWLTGAIIALILLLWAFYRVLTLVSEERVPNPLPDPKVLSGGLLGAKTDVLEGWLDLLAKYENCPPEGIIDTNGRLSVGPYCYQKWTFIYFVKKFDLLPGAEDAEIVNFWADPEFQRVLTRKVFEDSYNHYRHWYTSIVVRKLGLPGS